MGMPSVSVTDEVSAMFVEKWTRLKYSDGQCQISGCLFARDNKKSCQTLQPKIMMKLSGQL